MLRNVVGAKTCVGLRQKRAPEHFASAIVSKRAIDDLVWRNDGVFHCRILWQLQLKASMRQVDGYEN